MKILHVSTHFYPCIGGIEKYIFGLCRELNRLGHQSDVVCLNTCAYSRKNLPSYSEHKKIKIYRISYLPFKYYPISSYFLHLIKQYDIIHIHKLGFFTDFLVMTKLIGLHKKPLVLSTHGGIFHTKKLYLLKKLYFNFWCRFILKRISKTIADSKNDFKLFSKINPRTKLIENRIDYQSFSKIKKKPKGNTFIYIGRISKNKRIDNLIKTLYFVKQKTPDFKLFIIGEDWEGLKGDMKDMVKKMKLEKNIFFTGGVTDQKLRKYIARAKFFVSASEYEGFGFSVLEAMSSGTIPILNDIDSFRNFVKDKNNGFLVDYSKSKEVAELILSLINKDLSEISRNAKKKAKEYNWKETIKKIEKIYRELL